jgi:hypothetical protein
MALLLLQPGIEPLGQFDLDDTMNTTGGQDANGNPQGALVGGEIGVLTARPAAAVATDFYAADVGADALRGSTSSSNLRVLLDQVTALGAAGGLGTGDTATEVYGLTDEGATGYGTLFGSVIGGTAGQGTGLGLFAASNVVTVGPLTSAGSGKCTLWSKPGLYGCTEPAFWQQAGGATVADGAVLNDQLHGTATTTGSGQDGKLASTTGGNATGVACANYLGATHDRSLVSTTNAAAGVAIATEYHTVYLFGPGLIA